MSLETALEEFQAKVADIDRPGSNASERVKGDLPRFKGIQEQVSRGIALWRSGASPARRQARVAWVASLDATSAIFDGNPPFGEHDVYRALVGVAIALAKHSLDPRVGRRSDGELKRIQGQNRELEERVRELGRRIEDLERAIAAKDAVLAGKEEHIRDLRELKRAWVHIERVRIEKVLNVLSNNKVRVEATAKADLGLSEIVFQAIRRLGKVAVGIGKSLATAPESVRTKGRAFIEAARRLASELSVRVQGSEAIEHLQRELESVSSDTQASKKIDARSLPDLAVFRDRLSDGTEGPKMAILPAGRFLMGSPAKEKGRYKDEGP
ncbi:MAG: hypothetical protein EXQ95_10945, partial [Alphaproteobacteria bacterium]|nr:hypothetical protein [Alphaproteobacteria bacterium]